MPRNTTKQDIAAWLTADRLGRCAAAIAHWGSAEFVFGFATRGAYIPALPPGVLGLRAPESGVSGEAFNEMLRLHRPLSIASPWGLEIRDGSGGFELVCGSGRYPTHPALFRFPQLPSPGKRRSRHTPNMRFVDTKTPKQQSAMVL